MARQSKWIAAVTGTAALMTVLAGGLVPAQAATTPGWRVSAIVGAPADDTNPQPVVGSHYPGMVATSRRDAWALWNTCAGTTWCGQVLEHWNGTTWSARQPAALQKLGYPVAVGASSASDVWVFGGKIGSWAYLRWNGHAWSHHSLPSWVIRAPQGELGLTDVTVKVFGPSSVLVFNGDDQKLAAHYNGHRWVRVHLPSSLSPVDIVSRSDIWAVGENYKLEHWNGTSWRARSVPASLAPHGMIISPQEVSATGPRNVWTSVSAVNPVTKASTGFLAHWNGSTWKRVNLPASAVGAGSLTPDGHGGWWLTAERKLSSHALQWVFLHRTDGHWKTVPVPIPQGSRNGVDVMGLLRVPGTTAVLAAGLTWPAGHPDGQLGVIWRYGR